jgi:parallel beta-helix repeat protein
MTGQRRASAVRGLRGVAMLAVLLCWQAGFQPSPALAEDPGASETPCPAGAIMIPVGASIQTAVDAAGSSASFCIQTGIHRLQSVLPKSGQSFYGEKGSILNGARVLRNFQREGRFWVTASRDEVDAEHGVCARGRSACAQTAGFFIDDRPLGQVASQKELRAGQFFFDRGRGKIYFADEPAGRTVEVSATRHAFTGAADNVLIKGLVIEKYDNPAQEGAVWAGGSGWKAENLEARLNNGVGLVVGSNGAIVNCNVHHNGQLGIGVGGATNVVIRGNEVWGNNINGFSDEWEAGGVKVAESRNIIFAGNHVHHNAGPGLWCDENCRAVVFENNIVEYNSSAGIFYEISSGAVIRNNTLRENGQAGQPWFWGAEIQIAASGSVQVYGNTLTVRPEGKAIMFIDQNRARAAGGFYKTQGDSAYGNKITFLGDGVAGGASDAGVLAANYGIIQNGGNSFDGNLYRAPAGVTLRFIWGDALIDFAAFRQAGQERHGSMTVPRD